MALTATTVFEIQAAVGASDTLNSGGYDTATTGKPTDLTTTANTGNTASPVLKSATYNFNSGAGIDTGSWVHIATSGGASGWVAGWYKVLSVASNQATVDASIGAVVLANYTLNTAVGCSTAATPTAGTFSMDYSQVPAVVFSLTGLTTAAANAIILTASATTAMVGNLIIITGGTNFTAGTYVIQACSAGVSLTVDRNCTSAAGLAGTAGIGGALASPGKAGGLMVQGNNLFIKNGTYTVTSATANIAAGCISLPAALSASQVTRMIGYQTLRGDFGTRPTIISDGVITTFNLVKANVGGVHVMNIIADGNNRTSSNTFISNNLCIFYLCRGQNCTNTAFTGAANTQFIGCFATGCSTVAPFTFGQFAYCVADTNTITGFVISNSTSGAKFCIASNNSGSSSDGFNTQIGSFCDNCTAYNNGRHGFFSSATTSTQNWRNCLAVGNGVSSGTGYGFSASAAMQSLLMQNCAAQGNQTGTYNSTVITGFVFGFVTLTSDPFVNAAGGNFALTPAAIALLAGIPGSFPGLASTTGYLFIGAVAPKFYYSPLIGSEDLIAV